MQEDVSSRAGYEWLLGRAVALEGDLAQILKLNPPEAAVEPWHRGFYHCRVDLIDLLYPDDADRPLVSYLDEHRADARDADAVRLLADPGCELTVSEIRRSIGADSLEQKCPGSAAANAVLSPTPPLVDPG